MLIAICTFAFVALILIAARHVRRTWDDLGRAATVSMYY